MKDRTKPSTLELTKLVSVVYAALLISLGLIFPIAEALKDQWLKTLYNTIFLCFNLSFSSIFLIFLLFYVLKVNEKPRHHTKFLQKIPLSNLFSRIFKKNYNDKKMVINNKKLLQEKISVLKEASLLTSNKSENELYKNKTRRGSTLSTSSYGGIDLGILKLHNENNRSISSSHFKSELLLDSRCLESAVNLEHIPNRRKSVCHPIRENSQEQKNEEEIDEEENRDAMTWVDADSFGSVFTHHGSNLFLRLGALVFGLGNLINYALEIQVNLITNVECSSHTRYGWIFIFMFLFVILQTFFLFKHSKIHITRHQSLVWLGMVHLIFTNINLWIHTVIGEILDEFEYHTLHRELRSNNSSPQKFHSVQMGDVMSQALINKCDSDLLHSASKYLMPFVLEYCLIAVGCISCFLYFGALDNSSNKANKSNKSLIKVFSLAPSDFEKYQLMTVEELNEEVNSKQNQLKPTSNIPLIIKTDFENNTEKQHVTFLNDFNNNEQQLQIKKSSELQKVSPSYSDQGHDPLQKSHAGMFFGVIVLCITVVACVVFLFSKLQQNFARAEILYFITDIIVHSMLLVACLSVLFFTRNLAFVSKPISTDDILLLLACFGSLTYEVVNVSPIIMNISRGKFFSLESSSEFLSNRTYSNISDEIFSQAMLHSWQNHLDPRHIIRDRLQLTSNLLGIIQTSIQTFLIIISSRRYPVRLYEATVMPGRGTLAFLIVGNLSVWILRTILCKNLELPVQIDFYGEVACLLLINIHLPMLLFFRFHSSVCFADIWKCAYQLLTTFKKEK